MKIACPLQANQIKIRTLEPQHNEQIAALIRSVLKSYGLDLPGTAYFDPELSNLSAYYEQEGAAYFVMVNAANQVMGGVGIAPFKDNVCELQKLYLHEGCRRQGLGELLLRRALVFARKHYESIYLETHSTLKEAIPLYEKLGFRYLEAPLEGSFHSTMDIWMQKNF